MRPRQRPRVTEAQFHRELQAIAHRAVIGRVSVVFSRALDRRHAREARSYAQVNVSTRRFEFAHAVLELDEVHRLGLIAHEIGHVLAWQHWGDLSENGADAASLQFLKIRIRYDKRWPCAGGRCGLQTAARVRRSRAR